MNYFKVDTKYCKISSFHGDCFLVLVRETKPSFIKTDLSKVGRVLISLEEFLKSVQMLFQCSWVALLHVKVYNCFSLKILIQEKLNWSEIDIIILIKEFFQILTYISETKLLIRT